MFHFFFVPIQFHPKSHLEHSKTTSKKYTSGYPSSVLSDVSACFVELPHLGQ